MADKVNTFEINYLDNVYINYIAFMVMADMIMQIRLSLDRAHPLLRDKNLKGEAKPQFDV